LFDIAGLELLANILQPLVDGTAILTAVLLHAVGFDVIRDQGLIFLGSDFAYRIDYRCTGIWPVVIFSSLLLAERLPLLPRWTGIILGALSLLTMNLLRLVSLFWVGISFPAWFELTHDLIWPAITVLVIAALWLSLRRRRLAGSESKRGRIETSLVQQTH
jgi:exosortase/archaeosortase family protein